nr:cysteine-rich receptor-like protein kinase [Tanacetum cinerariifolium]
MKMKMVNDNVGNQKQDAAYLQQQLQIAQEKEAGIQRTQDEFEFMAAAYAYEEIERVKVNYTSDDTLQQALHLELGLSMTQMDQLSQNRRDLPRNTPLDRLEVLDYRPISLSGIHYKIVAKISANRLFKVIDSIMSHEQSVFSQVIKSLMELLSLVKLLTTIGKKMMLFKVDFEKAFDSVSWKFLDHVMEKLGFSVNWRCWIKVGLISSRAYILVNGSPTSEFSLKRGLRQGDPLSPFLFIIVMEGIHITLKDGLAANMFRGVMIGSPCIQYLLYSQCILPYLWPLN